MVQLKVSPCYNGKCYLEKEDRVKKRALELRTLMPLNLRKMRDVVVNLAEKN